MRSWKQPLKILKNAGFDVENDVISGVLFHLNIDVVQYVGSFFFVAIATHCYARATLVPGVQTTWYTCMDVWEKQFWKNNNYNSCV